MFTAVRSVGDEGWVDLRGSRIPRVSSFFVPLIEYARARLKACWQALPKPRGLGVAKNVAIRVGVDKDGRLTIAMPDKAGEHPEYAACLAEAMIGASVNGHAGANYTVVVEAYRGDPNGVSPEPDRKLLLLISGAALGAAACFILLVRRSRRRRARGQ